jgi:HEAT repeat protein
MIRPLAWSVVIGMFILMTGCSSTRRNVSVLENSRDLEERRNAAFQLSIRDGLDEEMLPSLIEASQDDDAYIREFAIKAIGRMDPKFEGVSAAIKHGLRDPDISVRRTAAAIFSTMHPIPTEVLVTLAETLCDTDSLLRSYVKSTFIDLGPIGVTALLRTCHHPNDSLRCRAASTLGNIGCEAKRALPILTEMLKDESERVRAAAQQSISLIQYSYFCSGE